MAKPSRAPSGPSQRMLRVGELVRHALADVLQRGEILDPVLEKHVVTVPEVRMSPDLKIATCYVMPLGGKDVKAVIDALAKNAGQIRAAITPRIDLKFSPQLRFRPDTSFDQGARIDALLASPQVQRDVKAAREDEA